VRVLLGHRHDHARHRWRLIMDKSSGSSPNDAEPNEAARRQLEKAETGDTDAARKVEQLRNVNSPAVDAIEQEESDGPGRLGLVR
jgi:hypothetical protein